MSQRKKRLLDLFCGAGGCAKGYQRAGFYVIGVDKEPQPNYCGDEFIQGDALNVLGRLICGERVGGHALADLAAIHASPPCQAYSPLNAYNGKAYPDLVETVRNVLVASGLPYVIENVVQAPLVRPIVLCGAMFGLHVYRHRSFESNVPLVAPEHPAHAARCVRNGYLPADGQFMSIHGGKHSKAWQRRAAEVMGALWMQTIREVCEAIPPAYTEHIGAQLIERV